MAPLSWPSSEPNRLDRTAARVVPNLEAEEGRPDVRKDTS